MGAALLLIDIQNDYFQGGAFPLPSMEAAASNAAKLLRWARNKKMNVIHVRHEEKDPGTGFLIQGTSGASTHESVAPAPGEVVITKHFPNSFRETSLAEELTGISHLFVVGAMSNMCVDATVRAAFDQGYAVAVAEDACAASDLEFDGNSIPHAQVHGAFMAALASAYGQVLRTEEIVRQSQ